ncbi:hypothetical protein F383_13830 [Gossypium arboreum]|uniref:Uncharacterized protein n=1 Tax=Gossypium arboreum TaxID=29729 RepID=A0A0B0MCU9_GOSAR|nr:hypothetical protein F383_37886 [Gossypium arboreum]KHG21224.1 hypothetical protein F383_28303 [Gossypium arboreum]KHG29867.1 hypothetical protein F383_36223 [Gossypium arboreum]KHG30484.1 hypothetical protein F383_36509 [Gossypium arboreum]KHG30502.1 hypothetical protein F383_13830 [Gossypium arboreum]
MFNRGIST